MLIMREPLLNITWNYDHHSNFEVQVFERIGQNGKNLNHFVQREITFQPDRLVYCSTGAATCTNNLPKCKQLYTYKKNVYCSFLQRYRQPGLATSFWKPCKNGVNMKNDYWNKTFNLPFTLASKFEFHRQSGWWLHITFHPLPDSYRDLKR